MKIPLLITGLLLVSISVNAQLPVKVNFSRFTDSSTAATMRDPAYLRNLSGAYVLSNGRPDTVFVTVSPSKKLLIRIPGQGSEHELVATDPIFFNVKGLDKVRILIFLDRFNQSRALDVIDEKLPKNSLKRQISFRKLGKFRES